MHEAIRRNLNQVELTLTQTSAEAETISPILAQTVRVVLSPQQGKIRGRSAVTLLSAGITSRSENSLMDKSAVSVAASAELIYIANRMHQAVNILSKENNLAHIYVLAADFLFSKATLYISSTNSLRTMGIASRTLTTISEASFSEVLSGSLGSVNNPEPFRHYVDHIREQIASVFLACGQSGAVIGGLDEDTITQCSNYGLNLGMVQVLQQGINTLRQKPAMDNKSIFEEWGLVLACMQEHFLKDGDRSHLQTIQTIVEKPTPEGLDELKAMALTYGPQAIAIAETTCLNFSSQAKACILGDAIRTETGASMIELVDLVQAGQVI